MKASAGAAGRIAMLDVARFLGICLVYYGHVVERIMYLGNPAAAAHYKFVYSFHMPFFFVLAGMTLAPDKALLPAVRFFRKLAASRLVPYFFFSALLALAAVFVPGHFVAVDVSSPAGYAKGAIATLMGFPVFNIPLWFLGCLVVVEILHHLLGRFLDTMPKLLATAALFYVTGYWLNLQVEFFPYHDFWTAHEAPVVYAFYLVGVALRRNLERLEALPAGRLWLAGAVFLAVLSLTWDMNKGPFRFFDAVVILAGGHGNVLLFPLTALAGSLLVLLVARGLGRNRFMLFMGENTLILFCLNGVFYHFLNGPYADWFAADFDGGWVSVCGVSAAFSALSLLACVPCVLALNRWLPQVAGKPAVAGPLLPRLVR